MARSPARPLGSVRVEIEGSDLPGRRCGPDSGGFWYENVHVGVARNREAFERVPGDATRAHWAVDVEVKEDEEGKLDFGGPFVAGPRDERHLGLIWIRELDDGSWSLFRAAKFRLYEMERSLFEEAMQPGRRLVGRLGLTDAQGWPRCATVRPPDITWSVEG
ncbi:MAG TPA: DUF5990 family protein [Acidimicrobiia bacterium]|nr:DUF5990 family protein [Acidimicrobiia bacterium]